MMKFPLLHVEEEKEKGGKLFNSPQREKIEINVLQMLLKVSPQQNSRTEYS